MGLPLPGLMCIPPEAEISTPHFAMLADIAARNGLTGLSMGMSSDFEAAIAAGATHIRVGSAIFGDGSATPSLAARLSQPDPRIGRQRNNPAVGVATGASDSASCIRDTPCARAQASGTCAQLSVKLNKHSTVPVGAIRATANTPVMTRRDNPGWGCRMQGRGRPPPRQNMAYAPEHPP